MLLAGRNAIVYGAGGSIGGAVARGFAREGARVHLTGRSIERLEPVAEEIVSAGGAAEPAEVDALDAAAVDAHADRVAATAGGIDVSFAAIAHGDVQGTPLVEMAIEDFERPVITGLRATLITARAAARQMIRRGSGVILTFGGHGDPMRDHFLGGLQVGLGAIEYLRRQLAAELGRHGIRVVGLQTAGVPESIPEDFAARERIAAEITAPTMLGRAATLDDVANAAAFAASDGARTITGSAINITCGAVVD